MNMEQKLFSESEVKEIAFTKLSERIVGPFYPHFFGDCNYGEIRNSGILVGVYAAVNFAQKHFCWCVSLAELNYEPQFNNKGKLLGYEHHERTTMRDAMTQIVTERGIRAGAEIYDWYKQTYKVNDNDEMTDTIKWEVFGE